ncbi:DUF2917 domain-containing protein [Phreatobacter sp. HK31-P]
MVCLDTPSRVHVRRGGIIRLEGALGAAVLCHAGAVWVTLEDDSRDILIEAGESFVIDRGGLSLVCAIAGPAEIEVTAAGAELSGGAPANEMPAELNQPARAA